MMVDSDYDGEGFNIVLSDVPERKNDLLVGEYELTSLKDKTTVAVKLFGMLGEEVLLTQTFSLHARHDRLPLGCNLSQWWFENGIA